MRRIGLKLKLHLSSSISQKIFKKNFLPNFHPTSKFTTSSSSPDELDQLIDTQFTFPEIEPVSPEDSGVGSVLAEEFAFLQGPVLGFNSSEVKNESGKCSDAYLIYDAIRMSNDVTWNETQKFLGKFREKLSESLVVDVLKLIKNADLGVKFFIWAGRQIGYNHSLAVYNALLDILGCDKNDRVADRFLREIKDDDEEVLGKLLNALVRSYCRSGSWNVALEELGRLKDFGCKPSRATYNALIQVFLEADKVDSAYLVHREMVDRGHSMDAHTLGGFAYSLCKMGRWSEALGMIEEEKFTPDTVIYTRMVAGLCEASCFEESMELLNRMRSNSCIPNVLTYRTLLCGCLNKGKLGRCKRILNMMIAEGCYPSPKIYNSLVHAYCKSGDYAYAHKLLKGMVRSGCKPGYVMYNIFIGGICGSEEQPSLNVLALAENAYNEMLDAGIVLNKINVSNYARCLCAAGKFDKAHNVIREMMNKGFVPDNGTYSKVISFMLNASKLDKAILLFKEMKRNGILPDVHAYTIMIDGFCKAGLIQQARTWFGEMAKDGCSPNVVTYTALIHAYLKARKVSDANELFEAMLSEGCFPNVVTFTALIDGHCKAGEIDKACQIYARMKGMEAPDVNIYFTGENSTGLEPNSVTYGALVDGLCKSHRIEEARELLNVMSNEGCEPDQIVYDALIDGFCKAGKLDEAREVFTLMCERGYSPNDFTYGSIIDGLFKDKQLDLALQVLYKMLKESRPPNVIIYTEMIDGLCKVGKTDEAYKLMAMMEEKGCHPNVVTYTAMIDGFGKVGKVEKCLELLRRMSSKGCAPNYVTYRVLIRHCCAADLLDDAHQLLEEMKQTYWPKHMESYRKVTEGFSREFLNNIGLLNEIKEYESLPVVPLYRLLIDSFRKAGRLEVALDLHKEICSSLSVPSEEGNTFSSLIECFSVTEKVDRAFELYADMVKKGAIPELSVFVNLIRALIKANRWEEAVQLSQSLCHMDIQWLPYKETSKGN